MGKPTGFLEWKRELPAKRPASERVRDWREFTGERRPDERMRQAGRCMDCGVPFCMSGCPLGNRVPEFNELVFRGAWREAFDVLSQTNNFPEFTGRLCPAPCEASCVLSINTDPVTIEQIEREIAEEAWRAGWVRPQPARTQTGTSVGVVGSGPAGLAAAQQLARAGHAVTVYEKRARLGGLLRFGIPDFKIEKWVIDRRLAQLAGEHVLFRTGVEVGVHVTWQELREAHDALLIAVGAERPRDLRVEGRELPGVVFAMDFLCAQNEANTVSEAPRSPEIHAAGKRVIVLGGGDTGSDCLGTAHRQGAASVMQVEIMPAPPEQRGPDNPWPQWPVVFRTSSSQEEGGERHFSLRTTKLSGDGKLERLHAVDAEGNEHVFEVDLLVLAMGFVGVRPVELEGLELTKRGAVATKNYRTSVDGIYSAGDSATGASLIVTAIASGRKAAAVIDADLRGPTS